MQKGMDRVADVGYSKAAHQIEVVVPNGTKMAELSKIIDYLARDVFSKFPRGCGACHSGDHFVIRERLENVIRVDLDSRAILNM
jgi:hypothetical protein